MLRTPFGPQEPRHLRHAWENWGKLLEEAHRFLALPDVQRALKDDAYRLTDFRKPFRNQTKGVGGGILEKKNGNRFESYDEIAEALYLAANHTQKAIANKNSRFGMRDTTWIQEQMNLLTDGVTLKGNFEEVEFVLPDRAQGIDGLRIYAILAVKKLLTVTHGKLDPSRGLDPIVTESHALHVVASHTNHLLQQEIHKRRINPIGTEDELRHGYSYQNSNGQNPSTDKVNDRLQGAWFRALQLDEYSAELLNKEHPDFSRPKSSAGTTLISEVCTNTALKHGKSPTFGEKLWGIGPMASQNRSINFRRDNIREQILQAIPLMTDIILNYPLDNPVRRKK